MGARCKIQSHTFICDGVEIEDEVFVGHGVVFVNDKTPAVDERRRPARRPRTTGRCSVPFVGRAPRWARAPSSSAALSARGPSRPGAPPPHAPPPGGPRRPPPPPLPLRAVLGPPPLLFSLLPYRVVERSGLQRASAPLRRPDTAAPTFPPPLAGGVRGRRAPGRRAPPGHHRLLRTVDARLGERVVAGRRRRLLASGAPRWSTPRDAPSPPSGATSAAACSFPSTRARSCRPSGARATRRSAAARGRGGQGA